MVTGDGTVRRDTQERGTWSWYTFDHKINVMERAGWIERMRAYPEAWRDTRRLTEAGRAALAAQKGGKPT